VKKNREKHKKFSQKFLGIVNEMSILPRQNASDIVGRTTLMRTSNLQYNKKGKKGEKI
jgi:hypothetical protein